MKKAAVLSILVVVVVVVVGDVASAQQPKKIPLIGYLSPVNSANESARSEGIRLALRKLGYIEGQSIAFEYRYAEGKLDRYPELASELVRLKVDIIVAPVGGAIQAAKNATKTIPIVMAGVADDPVRRGFVESLARPGGNITGITSLNRELAGKRLELLKEAVPKIARVGVLYDPAITASVTEVKEYLPVAARGLKLTIRSWEIRGVDGFEKVFAALNKERTDGLYVSYSTPVMANGERIADFALKRRLPSVHGGAIAVDTGLLMYYGADRADIYRRVAYFVDRILKGAKPADLPVEQPTKFELMFNLKTAKQIGVTIPQSVLYRADKVIK